MKGRKQRTNADAKKVIEECSDMVYRLAYARTGTRQDADDVYQEVFFRYLKKRPVFESEEHRKAWMLRVTVNCSNSFLSSKWRKNREELSENFPAFDKRQQDLHRELAQLPQKYRDVIHLFYYEELSVEEISKTLGRKPSTVRTQLTRARALLRGFMKEEDYEF